MTSVGDVARSASNHPVVAKCREFFDYFTEKTREFGTDLANWESGVRFAKPSEDAQRVMSDVVRETIDHLLNFARENRASTDVNSVERAVEAAERPAASDNPVSFIASEDDSRKPRGYYYYGNDLAMVETHLDTHLLLDLVDLTLTPTILKTGWWEPWIDILLRSTLQPGMTYVNAGANVGYHTMLGAKLVESYGKVFSFEANPYTYSLLRKSVYFNGFSGRTALFAAAVHELAGEMEFAYVREMLGGGGIFVGPSSQNAKDFAHLDGRHRLRERFIYEPKEFIKLVVPSITIDEAVTPEAETIDMLHMDVEGAEALALMGAKELIRRSRRLQLIIEWSLHTVVDEGLRGNYKRAAQLLADEQFKIYAITPPQGNVYTNPPDLRRIEVSDLLTIGHSDLYLTRD
jgi:FkbM family methyltransferase